jgi:hypothetical protein
LQQAILEKEKELQEAREQSRLSLAVAQVKKQYGFVPDLNVTPFGNAVRLHQYKNTHSLPMPPNMAFHDLTPTKCTPELPSRFWASAQNLFQLQSLLPRPLKPQLRDSNEIFTSRLSLHVKNPKNRNLPMPSLIRVVLNSM